MSALHIILSSLPPLCQKLLNVVRIWRSSDKNNFACFLGHRVVERFYQAECLEWKEQEKVSAAVKQKVVYSVNSECDRLIYQTKYSETRKLRVQVISLYLHAVSCS